MAAARITPHLSAARLACVAIAAVVLLSACFTVTEPQQALDAMNADRNANGVASDPMSGMLMYKAQAWADRLARENTLYHSALTDGISGCWRSLGENVGYGRSIGEVEQAYMASPHHRENIVNRNFNYAAVGVAHNGDRVFTVQVFLQSC
jgi:uncharacterized protein YkwD